MNVPFSADRQFEVMLDRVCGTFDVTIEQIQCASREQRYSWPRMVLCYVLREAGWELTRIGERLKRDHSSVHHAHNQVKRRIAMDADAARVVRYISGAVTSDSEDERALRELEATAEALAAAMRNALIVMERLEKRGRSLRDAIANPVQTRGAA